MTSKEILLQVAARNHRMSTPLNFSSADGNPFTISLNGSDTDFPIQYSYDVAAWTDYVSGTTLSLEGSDVVYFRGTNGTGGSLDNYRQFSMSGRVKAAGNIMSMCNYGELRPYCFFRLFDSCSALTTAPEFPAMTLAENCYAYMFDYCSSLTTAPDLPATTLADDCYSGMFSSCSALTTAPNLPATVLADYCYMNMFSLCSSLTTAPELPATTLTEGCYVNMFSFCSALTTAPNLPATALADYCYSGMFNFCFALNSISVSFTAWLPENATLNWMYFVSGFSTGTFTCPASLPQTLGENNIPTGWTIVTV